jgi:flagellar hook-basal body complex protein FliE
MSGSDLMKQFTGKQTGGDEGEDIGDSLSSGGRRRGKNSWLSHVKTTMKMHRGKSFKQVLKLAKKSYKKSQSSSQSQSNSGGRRRKSKVSKRRQRGGSSFAENAAPYPN